MDKLSIYHKSDTELEEEYKCIEASKKDPTQFENLYNRYHEDIFRYVYQRLDSKEMAFDITQQVFMKALANIKRYQFKGVPFSAWLYRVASNELNTFFTKTKQQRTINIESVNLESLSEKIDDDDNADMKQKLVEQLAVLDSKEIELIEMRYFEKRPFKEIGEILSITENNAKVRVYRVIDKLKKVLMVVNI